MNKNITKFSTIIPLLVWQIVFFVIPISLLFYNYFPYKLFFEISNWLLSVNFFTILFHTYTIGIVVASLCLCISFILAYCILQEESSWRYFFLILFFVPSISSFLIHMLSIMNFFYNWQFLNFFNQLLGTQIHFKYALYTKFITYLGYIYCYLPYAFIPIYNSLLKFDTTLLRASYDLGANFFQTIVKVLLPNTRSAIMTSFLLVFISSSSEFVITEILGGNKYAVVSAVISNTLISENLIEYSTVMIFYFVVSLLVVTSVIRILIVLLIKNLQRV